MSKLEPVEKFLRQVDLLDLLVRFSALVLLCDYFKSSDRTRQLDELIRGSISRPSLEEWYHITTDILKQRPVAHKYPIHSAFAKVYNRNFRKSIQRLIQIRNQNLGHGAKLSADEYIAISLECDVLLHSVLHHFQFIEDFLLCHVSTARRMKDEYLHKLLKFKGVSHQFLYSEMVFHMFLHAEEMLLVNLKEETHLSLHPFVVLEYSDENKQRDLFFYDMFVRDDLHYLSYGTGYRISTKKHVRSFSDLVGIRRE